MKKIYLLLFLSYTLTTITYGQTLIEDLSLSTYSDQTSIQALKSVTLTNGFHIPAGKTVTISIVDFQNLLSRPSADRNYILTRTFRTAIKKTSLIIRELYVMRTKLFSILMDLEDRFKLWT